MKEAMTAVNQAFELQNKIHAAPRADQQKWLSDGSLLIRIHHPVDTQRLQRALDELVRRHEALRGKYEPGPERIAGTPHGASGCPIDDRTAAITPIEALAKPVPPGQRLPGNVPPLRASLHRDSPGTYVLLLQKPRGLADRYSDRLIVRELSRLYHDGFLPEAPVQVGEVIEWRDELAAGDYGESVKKYWADLFRSGLPATSLLPAPAARPDSPPQYRRHRFAWDDTQLPEIDRLVKGSGLGPESLLIAMLGVLVHKTKGTGEITIACTFDGRGQPELRATVGDLAGHFPMKKTISPDARFAELWKETHENYALLARNQWFPLPGGPNAPAGTYNVRFEYNDATGADAGNPEWEMYDQPGVGDETREVSFSFTRRRHALAAEVTYDGNRCTPAEAERLESYLRAILKAVADDEQTTVADISIVSPAEKNKLLHDFNDTARPYPAGKVLHQLFEEQASRRPDKVAAVFNGKAVTYAELNTRANQLAHFLRATGKVTPDARVGVLLRKSDAVLVALLAIMKAGAAYLPIDADAPARRINYLISDGGVGVLLTESGYGEEPAVACESTIYLDKRRDELAAFPGDNPALVNSPRDLAYVLYTSGSTGAPKGTMLGHAGIVNRIHWMWHYLGLDETDIILQKTPYTFDVSAWELFMPVCFGASLVLCAEADVYDPEKLIDLVHRHRVSVIHFVPSMLNTVHDVATAGHVEKLSSLKHVITSGEALLEKTVKNYYGKLRAPLHNLYGPTEASIDVSYFRTSPDDVVIPIGKPIDNIRLLILDQHLQLVPVGVEGEICISGIGVARGYLNKEALTKDKFIPDPYYEGKRLYRTGDIGKWLPDGNVEYIGRSDQQVKIRGYRVELGEIENTLLGHEAVENAVVLPKGKDNDYLAAFVKCPAYVDMAGLKQFLHERLPAYMVPAEWIPVEAFPTTPSGKIDRKALLHLPAPGGLKKKKPGTRVEEKLARIWSEVLNQPEVGLDDTFFDLGGHSLKATRIASRISKELGARVELRYLFTNPTLAELAAKVMQSRMQRDEDIRPIEDQEHYGISHGQWRLWILDKMEGGSLAYLIHSAYKLVGLNRAAFERTLLALVERHQVLRTTFVEVDGQPRQVVHAPGSFGFGVEYRDLRSEPDQETLVRNLSGEESRTPFALDRGPLLRCRLLHTAADEYIFLFSIHHIITDGWSMEVIEKEIFTLYHAFSNQTDRPLAELDLHYKDYTAWQKRQLAGDSGTGHRDFWLGQFNDELPVLALSTDYGRPPKQTFHGKRISQKLAKSTVDGLHRLSHEHQASMFMVLSAVANVLLHKYTGQRDIIIGSPVAARDRLELENQVGFYVNTLPLRTRIDPDAPFAELLLATREKIIQAYEHQVYPFDKLVNELGLNRDMSRSPLFDVVLIFQSNDDHPYADLDKTVVTAVPVAHIVTHSDLRILFSESGGEITVSIDYNTDLFREERITGLIEHYTNLVTAAAGDAATPVRDLSCLSPREKQQLVVEFNATARDFPRDKTIVEMFEARVDKNPESPALRGKGRQWTYHQLNLEVNRLAHHLRDKYRVKPDDIVGLMVERSAYSIIGMLAILKAGAAYLPVDAEYPEERRFYMLEDAGVKLLLTESAFMFDFGNYPHPLNVFVMDIQKAELPNLVANPAPVNAPADLAYVIYTSGSTGKPKGVMIEHRANVNMVCDQIRQFSVSPADCLLQFASLSFDASVYEICIALYAGASLCIADKDTISDPDTLTQYLRDNGVTIATLPPSYLNTLGPAALKFLRVIITAGEAAMVQDAAACASFCDYYNAYGPTEAAVCVSVYKVGKETAGSASVPIGKPIANTEIYILDPHGQVVPAGHDGQLCIAGQGLARGYLNQPELTHEKFVPSPFQPGKRMYCSGDVGRWLPSGDIAYKGRLDDQVKVRGFRIELGEVANRLRQHEGVDNVFVCPTVDMTDLVAYVIYKEDHQEADLRDYLRAYLPEYMIPAFFVSLERFPLTISGKIDKRSLPAPHAAAGEDETEYNAPADDFSITLAAVWREVLGTERIGVHDNFFEIGGNSLKAIKAYGLINKSYPGIIKVSDLFALGTIHELSHVARTRGIGNVPEQQFEDGEFVRVTI